MLFFLRHIPYKVQLDFTGNIIILKQSPFKMKFTTTILSALLSTNTLAASAAVPEAGILNKRQCQYNYLPTLWHINSQTSQTGNPITDQVLIYRGSGPTKGFTDTLVEFTNIAQGSWGCSFEIDYEPNHGGIVTVDQGYPQQINVYQITGDVPASPTWANVAPITGSSVGTFNFPTGADLNGPQHIVINSFACAPMMRFRLSMNQQSLGFVEWNDDASSGLRIAHNC